MFALAVIACMLMASVWDVGERTQEISLLTTDAYSSSHTLHDHNSIHFYDDATRPQEHNPDIHAAVSSHTVLPHIVADTTSGNVLIHDIMFAPAFGDDTISQ
jgi:hypothetical protein